MTTLRQHSHPIKGQGLSGAGSCLNLAMVGLFFLMILVWLALACADLGIFSLWLVLGAAAVLSVLLLITIRKKAHSKCCREDLLAVIIAGSTLLMTLPPGELILGGWDPGVYLHTGMEIARGGSLQFDQPDLADLSPNEKMLFARNPNTVPEPFSGIRILPNGKLTPQFYHAYPSLLAVVISCFGLPGALATNAVLNIFSIIAFYALLASLFKSRPWALLGAVALALNPSQVWLAKFSTAELLAQLLVFSGFALLHRWYEAPEHRNTEALLGGMALGLAQLTRYDTLVLLAVALPVLLWTTRGSSQAKGLALALGALAVAIAHAWAHQRWIAPYYRPLGPAVGKALSVCILITFAGLFIRRVNLVSARIAEKLRLIMLGSACVGWVAWMSFNWLIRPTLHMRHDLVEKIGDLLSSLQVSFLMPVLTGPASRAMLYLENIFGIPCLLIALAGIPVLLLCRPKNAAFHAWVWGGLAVALLLTWHPFNDFFMMWVSRRYVPVVIPWLITGLIAIGMLAGMMLQKRWPSNRPLRWIAPAAIILSLAPVITPALFLAHERDWPGLVSWYENLQKEMPPESVVYTDQPGFAAPLRFIWGHQAYQLNRPNPEKRARLYKMLNRMAQRKEIVFLLTAHPPHVDAFPDVNINRVAHAPMTTHMLRNERTAIPRTVQPRGGHFSLYAITPKISTGGGSRESPNANGP